MFQTIQAIYEDGVFKPLETPNLSEHDQVRLTVEPSSTDAKAQSSPNSTNSLPDNPLAGLHTSLGIKDIAENFEDYRFGNKRP